MAIYRTTDAELTSIANAIRAKTGGNSPLIYPTGFVNAINNIMLYNAVGENATLVATTYEDTIKLSDTSFNASQLSTTKTLIKSASTLSNMSLSGAYQYIEKHTSYIKYQYLDGTDTRPRIQESYVVEIIPFGKKINSVSDLQNNTTSYTGYGSSNLETRSVCIANNGNPSVNGQSHIGIYFSKPGPVLSNNTSTNITYATKTPEIYAILNNSYITAESAAAIDTDKTILYTKVEVYQTTRSISNELANTISNMYQQVHNIT